MAPPQLAADAPGLDVLQPVEIDPGPVLGHELGLALLHRLDGFGRQGAHVEIPLLGQPRLKLHRLGLFVMRHGVDDGFDLIQQSQRLEIGDDHFPRHEAVEAAIFLRRVVVDLGILGQDVDHRQIVALADLEVVEIVRRGDLHRAGALFRIGMFVADDRDQAAHQRQTDLFADQMLQLFVFGMHRHRGIAQHGLGPCRGHGDELVTALDRIFQIPEMALDLDAFDFEIGNRGFQLGVPIDQPLVFIDQLLVIEPHEDLEHRLR